MLCHLTSAIEYAAISTPFTLKIHEPHDKTSVQEKSLFKPLQTRRAFVLAYEGISRMTSKGQRILTRGGRNFKARPNL